MKMDFQSISRKGLEPLSCPLWAGYSTIKLPGSPWKDLNLQNLNPKYNMFTISSQGISCGGTWTLTFISKHRILSPTCLPFHHTIYTTFFYIKIKIPYTYYKFFYLNPKKILYFLDLLEFFFFSQFYPLYLM